MVKFGINVGGSDRSINRAILFLSSYRTFYLSYLTSASVSAAYPVTAHFAAIG